MLPPMAHPVFLTLGITLLSIGTVFNILSMLYARHATPEYSSFVELHTQGEMRDLTERINDAVLRFEFGNYSITSDDEWATLFPPHGGQIMLNGSKYDVSLYLQLKCLDTVRVTFVALRDVFNDESPARAIDSVDFKETGYCLDVLRQTVLCTADVTLEPGEVVVLSDGSIDMAVTGNHVDHICRDWVQVREFVEKNQKSWDR
ncbi:uncharacterized protein BT62DRAFT_1004419 [Guyanagaster necrorhizus]|uniref:Uncharacterized protein n=1 Tax=Guyanagaster necrorhizus TaxID=856835 RepID=A0A9P7VWD6_9AGAR|nr:uncharacterized protein BT62DRAFT_1004419 [Guyanagaster necrorhizus MCA 3950]KAG7447660.1 hypothetical protein BT62DRAFT_1004419 [Guyanagaster necrorhizus MCA 3950]